MLNQELDLLPAMQQCEAELHFKKGSSCKVVSQLKHALGEAAKQEIGVQPPTEAPNEENR